MAGVTPNGIHYPDGASKAKNLGPELQQMAEDIDTYIGSYLQPNGPIRQVVIDIAEDVVADLVPPAVADEVDRLDLIKGPGPEDSLRALSALGHVAIDITPEGKTNLSRSDRGEYVTTRGRGAMRGRCDEDFRIVGKNGEKLLEIDAFGVTHIAQANVLTAPPERVALLFGIGQSNLSSRGQPFNARDYQHSRSWMLDWDTRQLQPATIPLSTPDPAARFGMGNVWPRLILGETGDDTAVVNVNAAMGSTSLLLTNDRPNGVWHPDYAGANPHRLSIALQALDDALDAIAQAWPSAKVDIWVMWHQGEADAADGATVAAYKAALQALIAAIRAHLGDDTIPFVSGGIVPGNAFLADADNVRQANIEVAAELEHVAYVEGIDNGGGSIGATDRLHYTREALERLAADMWTGAKRAANATADSYPHTPLDVHAWRDGTEVHAEWSAPFTRWTSFDVEWSTDQQTWTSITRPIPADTRETFTATGAGTDPVWLRVRTNNTGATAPASNYTTPIPAVRV